MNAIAVKANADVEGVDEPLLQNTEEQFDKLFAINAKGTFFALKNAGRHVADTAASSTRDRAPRSARFPAPVCTGSTRSCRPRSKAPACSRPLMTTTRSSS
ncbi:NAD(P)-dependent dehydrogenase (short-subunit alcohol dehydrogenase family) [Amycolatopsis endophytica]|uniref:NAD(P)-dependent dehydrogenase (Short-subunit alcohol dehydrogenase family) n=1 Tax=Amycolatopsis endophytica TaxID=860233 RepID=A0A853AXD1_9PSEU|nr:hypothetical protein [Amycolatopsis endophytica]NYI87274.1 NAD(P)-dependent dehydrogenase (short-subunit alcohol dehydrogenase family) [Amycolatopsis endophytica]